MKRKSTVARLPWLWIGLVVAFAISANWSASKADWEHPAAAEVSVTNHNPLDMDVFVLVGQTRIRLGTVVTSQTQNFNLPAQAIGSSQVRIVVDPVGSREAYNSEALSVSDGDVIRVTVAPQLAHSTVTVERGSA